MKVIRCFFYVLATANVSCADIAILHAVVTAAQDQIDSAGEPKLLPVAALFKAYDEILPQHGVDPDSDQHLSAFVFRVGGERGDGTLIENFQAILGRMGIVLEFGENTTVSARTSSSLAPTDSPSTRPLTSASGIQKDQGSPKQLPWARPFPSASTNVHENRDRHGDVSSEDNGTDVRPDLKAAHVLQSSQRAALSVALNRWHRAAAHGQGNPELDPGNDLKPTATALENRSDIPHYRTAHKNHNPGPKQREDRDASPEGPVYRPSLLSAVDRWRTTVVQRYTQEENHGPRQASAQSAAPQPVEYRSPTARGKGKEVSTGGQDQTPRTAHSSPTLLKIGTVSTANQKSTAQKFAPLGNVMPPGRKQSLLRSSQTGEEQAATQASEQRLMVRVARAREIYLGSKVFNHWADRTARRLEREAVARRHMIRFRCFRGWSQVPTSRTPAADHLRAATAAQKLQRAVAHHEEQLRLTAAAASQAYRLKKIERALNSWLCHLSEHAARQKTAARNRMKTLTKWFFQAGDDAALGEAVVAHRIQANEVNSLIRWNGQAERSATRQTAASQIGRFHLSFAYLRGWWDQSEAHRRAQMYQQYRLQKKATHVFDLWNLQARAQAFVWRNEYLSVKRTFDLWAQRSRMYAQRENEATQFYERTAKIRFCSHLRHTHQKCLDLERLESRTRLYIGAVRILDIFDAAMAQQRVREKEAVKRHLMMRYQQVSRERKRRNFFVALDHWRSLTAQDMRQASTAEMPMARQDSQQQLMAVEMWSHQALGDQQRYYRAQLQHGQSWLHVWGDASMDHEHQHLQARSLWAAGKQRQYQKLWSMSTLQQRGQAHTATVVEQRHDRERCNRAFHLWRQRCNKSKSTVFEAEPDKSRSFRSSSIFRNKLKPFSARRSQLGHDGDNLIPYSGLADTPTRRTGQFFPMGSLSSTTPMPAVRELDENISSSSIGDEAVTSPLNRAPGVMMPTGLPSTTPRGPVPTYLEREFRPRSSQPQQLVKNRSGPDHSHPPTRLVASQPSQGRPMLRSPGGQHGVGGRTTPRTLSRPPLARSVVVDARGPGQIHSDVPLASSLRTQSVGARPQQQYVISRRPIFGSVEDGGASAHASTQQTSTEMEIPFKQSGGSSFMRARKLNLSSRQARNSFLSSDSQR